MIEAPLPKVPVEVGVVPHWLAVEGAHPNTPHHPLANKQRIKRKRVEASQPVNTKSRRDPGKSVVQFYSSLLKSGEQQAHNVESVLISYPHPSFA